MSNVQIKIINRSQNPLPANSTPGSAGMDLRANLSEDVTIPSLGRAIVPTGIFIQLPVGYEAQIRPRSGLAAKSGITVLNSPGTIDSDYRGEICAILVNLSDTSFTIHNGDRICQMVIAKHETAVFEEVQSLDDTERGNGGFGHSGIK
ncbi:MAG: dUTP diphosphatase [Bacteroidales bacterium]|nr:dUTP diphosphatase [Bacteroidales bacterium]